MKMKLSFLFYSFVLLLFSSVLFAQTIIIASNQNKGIAPQEMRRYVYLCTGKLPDIVFTDEIPTGYKNYIIVGDKNQSILNLPIFKEVKKKIDSLHEDEFYIKTITQKGFKCQLVIGGNNLDILYGAYTFAEKMGVRFYLAGDVIPDNKININSLVIDELNKPLFSVRGILPFHDFPEGPDWWTTDDYKAIIGQLAKLKMNFIGLHTYPEGGVGPEPTVWIGTKNNVNNDGTVKESYTSGYNNSLRKTWGYAPIKTSEYYMGASELFQSDVFGSTVQKNMFPMPESKQENNLVFNNTGNMLSEAFTFAHLLGIKTCVGTETPLTIPANVKNELKANGKNVEDSNVIKQLYEGMFYRIKKTYPIDYFWMWTPEDWTWRGVSDAKVTASEKDIMIAYDALKSTKNPFQLATCGWVLGPPKDRSALDKLLPKEVAMSCINRIVGRDSVEPQFATVSGRQKWAIPWLEEDPLLSQPQLWVGRMRKDAADALKYGCTGLIGIHWRTQIIGPNVAALAAASWNQTGFKARTDIAIETADNLKNGYTLGSPFPKGLFDEETLNRRYMQADDFYVDWAKQNFGTEAASAIATIFSKIDGVFPTPSGWVNGPGTIVINKVSFDIEKEKYLFVAKMQTLRNLIKGNGNLSRFDYWLNTFKYYESLAKVGCAAGALKTAMEPLKDETTTLPGINKNIDFKRVLILT